MTHSERTEITKLHASLVGLGTVVHRLNRPALDQLRINAVRILLAGDVRRARDLRNLLIEQTNKTAV